MATTVECLTSPFNYTQTIIDSSKYVKLSNEKEVMMMKNQVKKEKQIAEMNFKVSKLLFIISRK